MNSKQTKIISQGETIIVALKTLRTINVDQYDIRREWLREATAHKQLNGTHAHLVQAVAAIEQVAADERNNAYHLVLEWADGGSLASFREKHRLPQVDGNIQRSRSRVMLVLKQIQGLVEALASMHEQSTTSPGHNGRNATQPPSLSPGRNESRNATTSFEVNPTPVNGNPVPAISIDGPDDSREGRGGSPTLIVSPPESGEQDPPGSERRGRSPSQGSDIWRHGDIKPENILRFIEGNGDAWIGTLKLADLGRAQKHSLMTQLRETREKEPWRTKWYEPPDLAEEVHERAQGKISRLFDIWSIGCVIFELSLWLLYGYNSIQDFLDANSLATNEQSATPYWRKIGYGRYEVSETASEWMNHILQYDHERDCAIGKLVELVRDRLLKVDLPPHSLKYVKGYRTNAADLKEQLHETIAKAERDEKYLFSGFDRSKIIAPHSELPNPKQISKPGSRSSLDPKDAEMRGAFALRGSPTAIAQQREYTNTIRDQWEVVDDDVFIRSNIRDCQLPSEKSDLCEACEKIDISSVEISFAREILKRNSEEEECDLCELVYSITKGRKIEDTKSIVLTKIVDSFVLRGSEQRLLRLCHTGEGKFRSSITSSQADQRIRRDPGCEGDTYWRAYFGAYYAYWSLRRKPSCVHQASQGMATELRFQAFSNMCSEVSDAETT